METAKIATGVKLEAACQVAQNSLRISYVLENTGSEPLIAYDGVTGKGEWPDLTGKVYVSYHSGGLQLKRIRPAGPKGMKLTYAVVPVVSSTMPGQKRQVRFSLALPVTEFNVHFPPDSSVAQYTQQHVERVSLAIGYFWKLEGTELRPLEANPDVFQPGGRFGEQLLVTATCAVPVNVRVRTDAIFQRQ